MQNVFLQQNLWERFFSGNNAIFIDMSALFLNVYIKCMAVWKKINVRNSANRQSLFLIIQISTFSRGRE